MRILLTSLVMFALAGPAAAQETARDLVMVWYTSHQCPPIEPGSPGATRETAITLEDFGDLYVAAIEDEDEAADPSTPSQYDCRWVRVSGFLQWMNYYHYRATLVSSARAAYSSGGIRYIVERFANPALRRRDLMRRQVTLVGRFYDLCAAAERARASDDDDWIMLFGPCHYGNDQGLMLDDVHVESVQDGAPSYLLGEHNRAILGDLPVVEGAERDVLITRTREWLALLRQGVPAYADAHFAAHPWLATRPAEEQRETREWIESPDGYIAYASERAMRLNLGRPRVEVFWRAPAPDIFGEAIGCVCLARSCDQSWPLTVSDAERFIGDAVCTELNRQDDGSWRW